MWQVQGLCSVIGDAGGGQWQITTIYHPLHVTKYRIYVGVIAILATDEANFATLLDTA